MARRATGQVITTPSKLGGPTSYAVRFRAYGARRYLTLGHEPEWTPERAEAELTHVLRQVERGEWQPPQPRSEPSAARREDDPTFHVFASGWFERTRHEWKPATVRAYRDELTLHLLPYFARMRLSAITVEEVDRYRSAKLTDLERWKQRHKRDSKNSGPRPIGPPTINKTLTRLGQILETAVEYGHIDRNPARGKRRRLKVSTPPRTYLDRAEQFEALLTAASELDGLARPDRQHVARRAILAVLMFGGLRISELLDLHWRDVDLAHGRIRVGERDGQAPDAKTRAGIRTLDLLPVLRDELATWKARAPRTRPADYVFATSEGGRPSKDNVRNRVLAPAIKRANTALEAAGDVPLPPRLTPHGLRHSFASLLVALGRDPRYVMDQLGHTDPAFTLRLYTHSMRRDDGDHEHLRSLVGSDYVPRINPSLMTRTTSPSGQPSR